MNIRGITKIYIGENEVHNFLFDGFIDNISLSLDRGLDKKFDIRYDSYFKSIDKRYSFIDSLTLKFCIEDTIINFFNTFEQHFRATSLSVKNFKNNIEYNLNIKSNTNTICKDNDVKVNIKGMILNK